MGEESDNGTASAPDRYMSKGRETVDRMRDLVTDEIKYHSWGGRDHLTAAEAWAIVCKAMALKYSDRAGAKGDPDGDAEKKAWWLAMSKSAGSGWRGNPPDPRSERPDFTPYEYDEYWNDRRRWSGS